MIRILARSLTPRGLALIAVETGFIVTAVSAAAYIRLGDGMWKVVFEEHGLAKTLLIASVCQTCLYYSDLYNLRHVADRRELFVSVIQALGVSSFALAAIYFWFPATIIGRGVFLIAAAFVISAVILWRIVFEWLTWKVGPRERLLLVGTGPAAVKLAAELFARRQELAVEIVGFIDADPARVGQPVINPRVIGTIQEIPAIARARAVDRVVVSLADARGKLPMDTLLDMKLSGVNFDHLASVYEEYTGKIAVENLRPSWLIFSSGFQKSRARAAAKRAMDVGVAAIALVVVAPLMALIAALVRLTSAGPVLYHQERVGHDNRLFIVHKFRSMSVNAEAATGPVWSGPGDTRATVVGGFLRRTRLDELPQLWNVLIGEMSLVGPRPERPEFVEQLRREIPFYGQRHVIRPGLTGWAQVRYTYGTNKEDALEKLQYDLFYIKNMSISLDVFIIVQTVKTVVMRQGA